MATGSDYLAHISLAAEDTDLVLTVFFAGGAVSGLVSLGSEQKPFNFAADPFFRRQDNYVCSGTVYIPSTATAGATERLRAISILFTNASNAPAAHRIELSSPRKLNFTEAAPGSNSSARLFAKAGNVAQKDSAQYVLVIEHP